MSVAATAHTPQAQTTGIFKYLSARVEHSLYRNGKVLTRRDLDGSDAGSEGVDLEPEPMSVFDARQREPGARCTLTDNGFELLHRAPVSSPIDFFQHQQVVTDYYRECEAFVQKATDALRVFAFDHNIRSATGKQNKHRIVGGQQVQGPAHVVHGDYTLTSAPQRLRYLTKPPGVNDTLRTVLDEGSALIESELVDRVFAEDRRFAIINVWRNISEEPVETHPLALCDARTVSPRDLVVFEIHYQDRIGENYFSKHSPHHRWYYYPKLTRDEALLIKQWDSAGELAVSAGARGDSDNPNTPCTFSFHSAFEDPQTRPDAPDRWSIEVRCAAIYPP